MKSKMDRMSLHVHMDSVWTYRNHVVGSGASERELNLYSDTAYTHMMPRLISWAEQRDAKLTIFVVALDLMVPEHAELVKKWHSDGHEIANHSWSHPPQFIALSREETEIEVRKSHQAIHDLLGVPPRGYAAPGWYDDRRIWTVLKELGYCYDASLLPSWVMLLQNFAVYALSPALRNHLKMMRSDWKELLFGPSKVVPKSADHVMRTPTPVAFFRLPFWHSLAFVLPHFISSMLIKSCMNRRTENFYYVVHPLDFSDPVHDQLETGYLRSHISFDEKWAIWRRISENFSGKKIVTMSELLRCNSQD